MCLAIPMKIVELKENQMATVDAGGATRDIALDLVPMAQVGDYVLVHAGFAIEVVDAQYAQETLDLIQEMADMVDDPLFNPELAAQMEAQEREQAAAAAAPVAAAANAEAGE